MACSALLISASSACSSWPSSACKRRLGEASSKLTAQLRAIQDGARACSRRSNKACTSTGAIVGAGHWLTRQ
jgi:hypothetical protein